MHRTQIQLSDDQWEAVNRAASDRGVSVAQVIRDAVERIVSAPPAARRATAIASIGGFHSGYDDVAERHDDHLADAFSS